MTDDEADMSKPWIFLCFFFVMIFTGCNGDDISTESDPDPNPEACSESFVLSGLKLGWKNLNHRISLWGIEPSSSTCKAAEEADISHVGGDWTTGEMLDDYSVYEVEGFRVSAPGTLGFHTVDLQVVLDPPDWEVREPVEVDLAAEKLDGFDHYVVLVHGLHLATDVDQPNPDYPMPEDGEEDDGSTYHPKYGWTTRGIALQALEVRQTDGILTFDAVVRFGLGPSDRENMNEAMPYARTEATAHFLVVGVEGETPLTGSHSYRLSYPEPDVLYFDDGQPQPHATDEQRMVHMDGAVEGAFFVGCSGWRWDLNPDGERGYYIRELSWFLRSDENDPAVLDIDGYASHTSVLMYDAMDHRFSIDYVLVPLSEGDVEKVQTSGEFGIGEEQAEFGVE